MNRRAFLTGLLSSAAAIAVAPTGALSVIPQASIDDLLKMRMTDCYRVLAEQIAKNLYGDTSGSHLGGFAELFATPSDENTFSFTEYAVAIKIEK